MYLTFLETLNTYEYVAAMRANQSSQYGGKDAQYETRIHECSWHG